MKWCDVLLSHHFMPMVLPFANIDEPWTREACIALVCKAWAAEWKGYLRRAKLPLRWSPSRIAELPLARAASPKRGRASINLTQPCWLACSDGLVYISDSTEKIYIPDSTGKVDLECAEFSQNRIVCMNESNEVMHILEEGHNFFTNVGDLAAGNGKLFVADNDQMRVFSFDAAIGSRLVASDPVTARVLGQVFLHCQEAAPCPCS